MCGIAGFAGSRGYSSSLLNRMAGVIRHRGPDDEGYFTIDAHGNTYRLRGDDSIPEYENVPHVNDKTQKMIVGFAHRRLSILDVSSEGHQPMSYNENRYIIVHNGEVYNYIELRQILEGKSYCFRSGTDTEVILAAYQEWGPQCVNRFIGMWSFAIWDDRDKVLFISRDRFGIKPLYYYRYDDGLFFASEIKSLLEAEHVSTEGDLEETYNYFMMGYRTHQSKTLFKRIKELPPGHNMIYFVQEDKLEINSYYSLESVVTEQCEDDDAWLQSYKNTFEEAIKLHLRSDVPVGSCLSGGLDSSAIVAFCSPFLNDKTFNTFTAAYPGEDVDEKYFAKSVADSFNNVRDHYTNPSGIGFWEDIKNLIWHQDLPIHSTSMFAQWEVMKLASGNGMKVLLDGQGADESLGGYTIYAGLYLFNLLKKGNIPEFLHEKKKLEKNRTINSKHEILRVIYYYLPGIIKKTIRQRVRIGGQLFLEDSVKNLETRFNSANNYKSFRSSLEWSLKHGLYELLRYEDRNSMAFSIESRVPFLDHRLVELSLTLPDNWRFRQGWSKYVLRKTIESKLPEEVVWRKDKKGFVTPQSKWKNELSGKIRDYINDYPLPAFIDRKRLQSLVNSNEVDSDTISEFWKFISLIVWIELFNVKY